jgi:Apea-like HEPN
MDRNAVVEALANTVRAASGGLQLQIELRRQLSNFNFNRPEFQSGEISEFHPDVDASILDDAHGKLSRLLELRPRLLELLLQQPEFQSREKRFIGPAGSGSTLDPEALVDPLLEFACERSAGDAASLLERILGNSDTQIRITCEVRGLTTPPGGVAVNGVTFGPYSELPPGFVSRIMQARYSQWTPGSALRPPSAFAVVQYPMKPLWHRGESRDRAELYRDQVEKITNTVYAFTGAGDAAPVVGRTWPEFVDQDIHRLCPGYSWGEGWDDAPEHSVKQIAIDARTTEFVNRYLALDATWRRKLEIASRRLNLARRRRQLADRAIDASIALEALLGDGDRFDLTYKLRLRAALLLDDGLDTREATSRAVNDLYRARSAAVHGASISPKKSNEVTNGTEVAAKVIRKIVEIGRSIDLQKLELGGDVSA